MLSTGVEANQEIVETRVETTQIALLRCANIVENHTIETTVLLSAKSAKSVVGTTISSQCARVVMINASQANQGQRRKKSTKGKNLMR